MAGTTGAHYYYVNNIFAIFFKSTIDWFETLSDRFEWKILGTYDKAVEYIRQQNSSIGREFDQTPLPALVLDPGDFNFADANSGANQLWRFPLLNGGMISRLHDPIYEDSNITVTPGYSRFKGEFELIVLCNSFYEYCDLKILFMQYCGGFNRYIKPVNITSYIILDDDLVEYTYTNSYTSETYSIDWDANGASDILISNMNQTKKIYPIIFKPVYKLTGISDGSEKYGSTDNLSEWKFTCSIEYEVEIPTFLILEIDNKATKVKLNFDVMKSFTINVSSDSEDNRPPQRISIMQAEWDLGLVSQEHSIIQIPTEQESYSEIILNQKTRYYHEVTADEADSTSNILIELAEEIDNINLLRVFSNYGDMKYGDYWTLENSTTISINVENVILEEGQIIELYIYEEE